MKKRILTADEVRKFNELRAANQGKSLTWSQLCELMRTLNLNESRVKGMFKTGIFIRVQRGEYAFPKEPVYKDKLQRGIESYPDYKKNPVGKKSSVEIAIDLLKAEGYRVQKQCLNTKAAMCNPDLPVNKFIYWETL